eukprot:TRINITY_DN9983_c0_g1_i5.p1 TRINITY_DN9983_c0_g1~~TRINITY_DN9983_c0_g1_i5.p1  ORF type:complete len:764 (+),score=248.34 TRINITY_DN9983_c0_g1_i5:55-2346(+)
MEQGGEGRSFATPTSDDAEYYDERPDDDGFDESAYYLYSEQPAEEQPRQDELAAENRELRGLVSAQEREREQLEKEVQGLRRQLQAGASASAASERRYKELAGQLGVLQDEMQEQAARLAEEDMIRRSAEGRAKDAEEALRERAERLEEAEAVRSALEARLAASEDDAQRLQQMLQQLREEQKPPNSTPRGTPRGTRRRDAAEVEELIARNQELERRVVEESQLRRDADIEAMRARTELAEREVQWECRTERSRSPSPPLRSRRSSAGRPDDSVVEKELADMTDDELAGVSAGYSARIAHMEALRKDVMRQQHRRQPDDFADPDAPPPPPPAPTPPADAQADALDDEWMALCNWMRGRLGGKVSLLELQRHIEGFAPKRMRARSPATTRAASRLCSPTPFRSRMLGSGQSVCGESSIGVPTAEDVQHATTPRATLFSGPESAAGSPTVRTRRPQGSPTEWSDRPRRGRSPVAPADDGRLSPASGAAPYRRPAEGRVSPAADVASHRPHRVDGRLSPSVHRQQRSRDDSPPPRGPRADEAPRSPQSSHNEAYSESMRDAARERGRRAYQQQKEQRQLELQRRLQELRQPVARGRDGSRAPSSASDRGPPPRRGWAGRRSPVLVAADTQPRSAAPQTGGGAGSPCREEPPQPVAGLHRAPQRRDPHSDLVPREAAWRQREQQLQRPPSRGTGHTASPAHQRHVQRAGRHSALADGVAPSIHAQAVYAPGPAVGSAFRAVADEPPVDPGLRRDRAPLWRQPSLRRT